jgi:carotenoid cleavage dioxygenase-like enzyme
MCLTGKYAVLFDGSARFTPQQMVEGKPVFSWDASFTTRVGLVPRNATASDQVQTLRFRLSGFVCVVCRVSGGR